MTDRPEDHVLIDLMPVEVSQLIKTLLLHQVGIKRNALEMKRLAEQHEEQIAYLAQSNGRLNDQKDELQRQRDQLVADWEEFLKKYPELNTQDSCEAAVKYLRRKAKRK
jgi:hypothetical protein